MSNYPYYERKGGSFSRGDTIAKIADHLREAAKGCDIIAHDAKMQDKQLFGGNPKQWKELAETIAKAANYVLALGREGSMQ